MNEIICVYCGKTITDESAIQLYDDNYNMSDSYEADHKSEQWEWLKNE